VVTGTYAFIARCLPLFFPLLSQATCAIVPGIVATALSDRWNEFCCSVSDRRDGERRSCHRIAYSLALILWGGVRRICGLARPSGH
jgi:hypothetical protein